MTASRLSSALACALLLAPAAARAATLTVTTTSATNSADGQCDLVEAISAARTQEPVNGDCPAGDGNDQVLLAAGSTYAIDQTLRIESAVQITVAAGAPATITAGGSWRHDAADRWSDCALFAAGDAASLGLANVGVVQASPSAGLTGICVTAGALTIRNARVSGFDRGGVVSLCEPAVGCDHDGLGQFSAVYMYGSLVDLNHSADDGGGILSRGVGASLAVEHSSIVNNVSETSGGGLAFEGGWNNHRISNSTISGNSAATGGGVYVHFAPMTNTYVYMFSTTIANNSASGSGGGVAFEGDGFNQDANVYASILTNNRAATDEVNINADWKGGRMSCTDSSLIYVAPGKPTPYALPGEPCRYDVADARFGPLMSMGGKASLPVLPLLPGSPAIDAAPGGPADQERDDWIASVDPPAPDDWTRFDRNVDGDGDGVAVPDLGAYEVNLRWQTELLAVAATGPAPHTVITTPDGFDRGAGTLYAATSDAGEFVTYVVPVAEAGTYDVTVGLMTAPDAGAFRLAAADDPGGPWTDVGAVQDGYAMDAAFTEVGPLSRVTFTAPGQKYLRFTVAGKNAQGGGYRLYLDYLRLTAAHGDVGGGGGCGCAIRPVRPAGESLAKIAALVAALVLRRRVRRPA